MFTKSNVSSWVILSRYPFHLAAILPFILGSVVALRMGGSFDVSLFVLALVAIILILVATHYNGEVYDVHEDRLSAKMEKNAFSAGTQLVVQHKVDPEKVKIASYIAISLAIIIGLVIKFYYGVGIWIIPLGLTGIIFGFYYSKPPLRFVERGIGEILIGYAYSWLPVTVAFYLQTGSIISIVNWVSIPIACTIFNVILINEYPDYPADEIAGKKTLVVRFGKEKSSFIYAFASLISVLSFFWSMQYGFPRWVPYLYLPICVTSVAVGIMMLKGRYKDRKKLELMCAATLLVNMLTNVLYITGIFFAG